MFNTFQISKSNLINNIKQVKLNNPNSLICAMVKANAYGVGLKEVVAVIDDHVDYYGVACFFEAKALARLTDKKILILGALDLDNIDSRFSYSCNSLEELEYLIRQNIAINVHLKVNTGMNRYGFDSIKDFKTAIKKIKKSKLILEGVYTHFATTDDFVAVQYSKFVAFMSTCQADRASIIFHADNSFVNQKFNHSLSMVRIGFSLYNRHDFDFRPVTKILTHIVQTHRIKKGELVGYDYRFVAKEDMLVATIPIGYADGFDMKYIGIDLYVKGKRIKVLNICMDCSMLDISNTGLKKGDEIYILDEINSLSRYSKHVSTSEYEIMTKFSHIRAVRELID